MSFLSVCYTRQSLDSGGITYAINTCSVSDLFVNAVYAELAEIISDSCEQFARLSRISLSLLIRRPKIDCFYDVQSCHLVTVVPSYQLNQYG